MINTRTLFVFYLLDIRRVSAQFPPSMRCACLSRPSVSWPFTNDSLKVAFYSHSRDERKVRRPFFFFFYVARQRKRESSGILYSRATSSVRPYATWKSPSASRDNIESRWHLVSPQIPCTSRLGGPARRAPSPSDGFRCQMAPGEAARLSPDLPSLREELIWFATVIRVHFHFPASYSRPGTC